MRIGNGSDADSDPDRTTVHIDNDGTTFNSYSIKKSPYRPYSNFILK
jgi:hypothetical protein